MIKRLITNEADATRAIEDAIIQIATKEVTHSRIYMITPDGVMPDFLINTVLDNYSHCKVKFNRQKRPIKVPEIEKAHEHLIVLYKELGE